MNTVEFSIDFPGSFHQERDETKFSEMVSWNDKR